MNISLLPEAVIDRIDCLSSEGELAARRISGVSSLKDAVEGDVSFAASAKFSEELAQTKASIVLLPKSLDAKPRPGQQFFRVDNPSLEIAKICEMIAAQMEPLPEAGIHPSAQVHPSAQIDPSASIGAFVSIGADVLVGPECVIGSGASLGPGCRLGMACRLSSRVILERQTQLGDRVRIHAGAVLGSDGFGYEFEGGRHRKNPQIGLVTVGDDVEIGANTTIDCGRFGATSIGEGSKIDNLVQIGHNCRIGKHCILCGQVGLAGSTELGDYVVMGGAAGAAGHLKLGDGAQLAGCSIAFSDLEGGAKYGGNPAVPLVAFQRMLVVKRRLPELFRRLRDLERRVLQP